MDVITADHQRTEHRFDRRVGPSSVAHGPATAGQAGGAAIKTNYSGGVRRLQAIFRHLDLLHVCHFYEITYDISNQILKCSDVLKKNLQLNNNNKIEQQ